MKINGPLPLQAISAYSGKKAAEEAPKQSEGTVRDRIEISSRARELQELKNRAESIPDVRTDQVTRVQQLIDRYQVNLDRLADNLINEIAEQNKIKGQ